ncbi:MAG TPA: Rrf2 family transcriptional regulator [Acidimicrobiales bacterium]|nr:Rrf2 family transcriptional regulator [Acidimicrobiales bacterium]
MHISAKVDYAVRALVVLAAADGTAMSGGAVAEAGGLPAKFLDGILAELRRSGLVLSQRGSAGGYRLARSANEIAIADVFRAIDGPLAEVRGERPEHTSYDGVAHSLQGVWIAVRASLRSVLEQTTIADVATGHLPRHVQRLIDDPDSWIARFPA